ncbi:hypothetical protein D3C86_1146010 [compost metagenome]
MGAWGVGTDRGDQGRFVQARWIDHRASGRGAEHDHVGVLNGGFATVDDVQARFDAFQQARGFNIIAQVRRVQADALPVAQMLHVVQMRLGHFAATDDGQASGGERRESVDRYCGSRGGAGCGQFTGIAEQQRLAGLCRHQQRPRRHQRALLADDVRRSLDPVNAVFGQHAQVVDEVAGALRKFHQLLRRLHGLSGRQVTEHFAQDLRHVDLRQQFASLGLIDHMRRTGHGRLRGWI